MGAVNKIPGVSGGIVALVFGFYEKLILSFSRFDFNSFTIFRKKGFKSFIMHINGEFLALLLIGIIISFFSTSLIIGFFGKLSSSNFGIILWYDNIFYNNYFKKNI